MLFHVMARGSAADPPNFYWVRWIRSSNGIGSYRFTYPNVAVDPTGTYIYTNALEFITSSTSSVYRAFRRYKITDGSFKNYSYRTASETSTDSGGLVVLPNGVVCARTLSTGNGTSYMYYLNSLTELQFTLNTPPAFNSAYNALVPGPGNSVVTVGADSSNYGSSIRVYDSDGVSVVQNRFSSYRSSISSSSTDRMNAFATTNSRSYLYTITNDRNNASSKACLTKWDLSNLSVVWNKNITGSVQGASAMVCALDDSVFVADDYDLMRVSSSGNLLWAKRFGAGSEFGAITGMAFDAAGYLYICTYKGFVLKTAQDGSVDWGFQFVNAASEVVDIQCTGICVADSKSFILGANQSGNVGGYLCRLPVDGSFAGTYGNARITPLSPPRSSLSVTLANQTSYYVANTSLTTTRPAYSTMSGPEPPEAFQYKIADVT